MDEKQLKTSPWQRVVIIIVAILLLGSTIFTYMFIVMSSSNNSKANNEERIAELRAEYDAKNEELQAAAKPLSDKYFKEMSGYKTSQVKSYNAAKANSEKLKTEDLKVGTGRELAADDTDYSAYYIGWCADGSIFDSSFSYAAEDTDKENPTGLSAPLPISSGLIEGWKQGVVGMKLGGVRQLTIPGELAYGESRSDVCGTTNAPLKFVVMAIENDANLQKLNDELEDIYAQLYAALLSNGASN